MAALPLPNIDSNQKSSAIVIFDVTRHIFDIPKCGTRSELGVFFRLAERRPLLQLSFQFGFVIVEIIIHVGDGERHLAVRDLFGHVVPVAMRGTQ